MSWGLNWEKGGGRNSQVKEHVYLNQEILPRMGKGGKLYLNTRLTLYAGRKQQST